MEIRAAFERLAPQAGLELRLGFELTPTEELLGEDLRRYALEGTDAVLVEVPFQGPIDLLVAVGEHVERSGLRPLVAHPERTDAILDDPRTADGLAERGWLLQVNSSSLLGRHGAEIERVGWALLERGAAALVASDGHRRTRPPHLDEAYAEAVRRVGEAAEPLFNGAALRLDRPPLTASREATRVS